jgi:pimeloyl-ACP methyl ester carboxylesterase
LAAPLIEDREVTVHGNVVGYRAGGSGPAMVLLHGIASNARTWDPVIEELARDHAIVAPDLSGHSRLEQVVGDFSIGGYASLVRDFLMSLGMARVTLVGHSLGGGIALQLLHMAPELVARLVLVDSGGLGTGLGAPLRAASLPGAPLFIRAATSSPTQAAARMAQRMIDRAGVRLSTDMREGMRGFSTLHDPAARQAFVDTARASTGLRGQQVSAVNKLYLMAGVPLLTIWGEHDTLIPIRHAHAAAKLLPHMQLAVIAGAGHFPHVDDPAQFTELIRGFEQRTQASTLTLEELQLRLQHVGQNG